MSAPAKSSGARRPFWTRVAFTLAAARARQHGDPGEMHASVRNRTPLDKKPVIASTPPDSGDLLQG